MRQPLAGIRVLALEQFGAGPYGSMYMADLGAEVIKIENTEQGGDPARRTGKPLGDGDSAYFQTFNMRKKSVTLDLKSADGRARFRALAKTADIVWNNLRGNQPAKLGLDYASLREIKPGLICTHISAYGRDNDRADWPGRARCRAAKRQQGRRTEGFFVIPQISGNCHREENGPANQYEAKK